MYNYISRPFKDNRDLLGRYTRCEWSSIFSCCMVVLGYGNFNLQGYFQPGEGLLCNLLRLMSTGTQKRVVSKHI